MPTTYRRMRNGDYDAALALWAETSETDPHTERREFCCDPRYLAHTHVAVDRSGTLLATAHYWTHRVRDASGTARRVACLSHMATRPEARRQGQATRLLEHAIEGMRRESCAWSLLLPSEEGQPLYERHGWRPFRRQIHRAGILATGQQPVANEYVVEEQAPAREIVVWAQLAEVYAAYSAHRPLHIVRSHRYWAEYLALKLSSDWYGASAALVLTARRRDDPTVVSGYAIAYLQDETYVRAHLDPVAFASANKGHDGRLLPYELGVRAGDTGAIKALLSAASKRAVATGVRYARTRLPHDPAVEEVLAPLLSSAPAEWDDSLMARPLNATIDWADLNAVFEHPSAYLWPLDDF